MTTDIQQKMNSFGVQLNEDFNMDHLYCVDHKIQLTASLHVMTSILDLMQLTTPVSAFKIARQMLVSTGHQRRQLKATPNKMVDYL
jgi:hypothetical protein